MRSSELYALHWEDIEFEAGCIHIRRAVWNGHLGAPKTGDPKDVALTDHLVEVLRDHRREQLCQGTNQEAGLVFPSEVGTPRRTSTLYHTLRQLGDLTDLKLKLGPRVLRRTFNTLMVEAGVNQVVLRSQMGHNSSAMIHRYVGIHIERKQDAVAQLIALTQKRK